MERFNLYLNRFFLIVLLSITCLSKLSAQAPQQMFWALNKSQYLLDQIGSTNASVAYSVRKLKVDYTGPAMRVRRNNSGADAEADVYFDGTGVVSASSSVTVTKSGGGSSVGDVLSFSSFYSGKSVYVKTWYDQSGNGRDVSQTTTGNQPRIINSGSPESANSISSIRFINSSSTVLSASISTTTMFSSGYIGTASLVIVASSGSTSSFGFSDGGSDRWQAHISESSNLYFDVGNSYNRLSYNNSSNIGLLRTYVLRAAPSSLKIWISGSNVASSTPSLSSATTSTFYVGGIPTFPGSWYHDADQSEIIIFPKALSDAEISILNSNQKAFYGTP